jgi:hypothetical protein
MIGNRRGAMMRDGSMSRAFAAWMQAWLGEWWLSILVSITAVLLAAASVTYVQRPIDMSGAVAIGDYATLLFDPDGVGLPFDLAPAWTASDSSTTSISGNARAARIGARLIDLEIAARARNAHGSAAYYDQDPWAIAFVQANAALVASYAGELASNLDHVSQGDYAAYLFRYTESEGKRVATISSGVITMARRRTLFYRPRFIALGNWLEAARVAALRGDRTFLARPECLAEATKAPTISGLSPAGRIALERVRALMPTDSTTDLDALERALTDALYAVTN